MSTEQQDADKAADVGEWIPYGKQSICPDDIDAVVDVLTSQYLTTGPKVAEFENAVLQTTGAAHAIAVNSGTAALHSMLEGFGVGPGDEVIVPSITFAATATAVMHAGAKPVFADIDPATVCIGPEQVEPHITKETKAVVAVDFGGQPCDYSGLHSVLAPRGLFLFADACHSIGGSRDGTPVGRLADATTFSFHPVKHITTGEGGMVVTNSESAAAKMRRFRNHGISATHAEREQNGEWFYEIAELGMNYRLSDFQCALGISQLRRLSGWVKQRQSAAAVYDRLLKDLPGVTPLHVDPRVEHAYHLYVVRIDKDQAGFDRKRAFAHLRRHNVGANVHYIPVHFHPLFREQFGTSAGQCPHAEAYYEEALTLPLFPSITEAQIEYVIELLTEL